MPSSGGRGRGYYQQEDPYGAQFNNDRTMRRVKALQPFISNGEMSSSQAYSIASDPTIHDDKMLKLVGSAIGFADAVQVARRFRSIDRRTALSQTGIDLQREWEKLDPTQQELLHNMGVESPAQRFKPLRATMQEEDDPGSGGFSFSNLVKSGIDLIEGASVEPARAGWDVGWKALNNVGRLPSHLWRVSQYQRDRHGGGVDPYGNFLNLASQTEDWLSVWSHPTEFFDVWERTGANNGEGSFLESVDRQARIIAGDRQKFRVAKFMMTGDRSDSVYENARAWASETTGIPEDSPLTATDPKFRKSMMDFVSVYEDPKTQETINHFDKNHMSPGRELANNMHLRPGMIDPGIKFGPINFDAYNIVSGSGDMAFQLLEDPLLLGGKAVKIIRAGEFATSAANWERRFQEAADFATLDARAAARTVTRPGEAGYVRELFRRDLNFSGTERVATIIADMYRGERDGEALVHGWRLLGPRGAKMFQAVDDADQIRRLTRGAVGTKFLAGDMTLEEMTHAIGRELASPGTEQARIQRALALTEPTTPQVAAEVALGEAKTAFRGASGTGFSSPVDVLHWMRDDLKFENALASGAWSSHLTGYVELPRLTGAGLIRSKAMLMAENGIWNWADFTARHKQLFDEMSQRPEEFLTPMQRIRVAAHGAVADSIGGRIWEGMGRSAKAITSRIPTGDTYIPLKGQQALREVQDYLRIGFTNRAEADAVFGQYLASSTIAGRRQAIGNALRTQMDIMGITRAHPEWADEMIKRLSGEVRAAYSAHDTAGTLMVNGEAIPAAVYPFQVAELNFPIPSFRDMMKMSERDSMFKMLRGGVVNSPTTDAFMGRAWKPAMVMRLGFIPRSLMDEMLPFVFREGVGGPFRSWFSYPMHQSFETSRPVAWYFRPFAAIERRVRANNYVDEWVDAAKQWASAAEEGIAGAVRPAMSRRGLRELEKWKSTSPSESVLGIFHDAEGNMLQGRKLKALVGYRPEDVQIVRGVQNAVSRWLIGHKFASEGELRALASFSDHAGMVRAHLQQIAGPDHMITEIEPVTKSGMEVLVPQKHGDHIVYVRMKKMPHTRIEYSGMDAVNIDDPARLSSLVDSYSELAHDPVGTAAATGAVYVPPDRMADLMHRIPDSMRSAYEGEEYRFLWDTRLDWTRLPADEKRIIERGLNSPSPQGMQAHFDLLREKLGLTTQDRISNGDNMVYDLLNEIAGPENRGVGLSREDVSILFHRIDNHFSDVGGFGVWNRTPDGYIEWPDSGGVDFADAGLFDQAEFNQRLMSSRATVDALGGPEFADVPNELRTVRDDLWFQYNRHLDEAGVRRPWDPRDTPRGQRIRRTGPAGTGPGRVPRYTRRQIEDDYKTWVDTGRSKITEMPAPTSNPLVKAREQWDLYERSPEWKQLIGEGWDPGDDDFTHELYDRMVANGNPLTANPNRLDARRLSKESWEARQKLVIAAQSDENAAHQLVKERVKAAFTDPNNTTVQDMDAFSTHYRTGEPAFDHVPRDADRYYTVFVRQSDKKRVGQMMERWPNQTAAYDEPVLEGFYKWEPQSHIDLPATSDLGPAQGFQVGDYQQQSYARTADNIPDFSGTDGKDFTPLTAWATRDPDEAKRIAQHLAERTGLDQNRFTIGYTDLPRTTTKGLHEHQGAFGLKKHEVFLPGYYANPNRNWRMGNDIESMRILDAIGDPATQITNVVVDTLPVQSPAVQGFLRQRTPYRDVSDLYEALPEGGYRIKLSPGEHDQLVRDIEQRLTEVSDDIAREERRLWDRISNSDEHLNEFRARLANMIGEEDVLLRSEHDFVDALAKLEDRSAEAQRFGIPEELVGSYRTEFESLDRLQMYKRDLARFQAQTGHPLFEDLADQRSAMIAERTKKIAGFGPTQDEIIDAMTERVMDDAATRLTGVDGRYNYVAGNAIHNKSFRPEMVHQMPPEARPIKWVGPKYYVPSREPWNEFVRKGYDVLTAPVASMHRQPMFQLNYVRAHQQAWDMLYPRYAAEGHLTLGDEMVRALGFDSTDELHHVLKGIEKGIYERRDLSGQMSEWLDDLLRDVAKGNAKRMTPELLQWANDQGIVDDVVSQLDHPTNLGRAIESFASDRPDKATQSLFSLDRWYHKEDSIRQDIAEIASQRAFNDSVGFIDDHRIRSQAAEHLRNTVPFYYAHELFMKRLARSVLFDPIAIYRMQLLMHGIRATGWLHKNEYGDEVWTYPGVGMTEDLGRGVSMLFGKDASVPFQVPLTGQIKYTSPGFGDLGLPAVGPIVSIPMNAALDRFPENKALQDVSNKLLGSRGIGRSIIDQLVPASVARVYKAATQDADSSREFASIQTALIQMMSANALELDGRIARIQSKLFDTPNGPERQKLQEQLTSLQQERDDTGVPGPQASPRQKQAFIDKTGHFTRIVLLTKSLYGFVGPAAPAADTERVEDKDFRALLSSMPIDEAVNELLRTKPNATPFTVFGTSSPAGTSVAPTDTANEWLTKNAASLDRYPMATPWLLPQEVNDDPYSERAYRQQLRWQLRERRTMDEVVDEIAVAEASRDYFARRDAYEVERARLGEDDRAKREALDYHWVSFRDAYFNQHPVFAERLRSPQAQFRRQAIIEQLNAMRFDDAGPVEAHTPEMQQIMDDWNTYQTRKDLLKGKRSDDAMNAKARNDTWIFNRMSALVAKHPRYESLWLRVFRPEIGLDSAELEDLQANQRTMPQTLRRTTRTTDVYMSNDERNLSAFGGR